MRLAERSREGAGKGQVAEQDREGAGQDARQDRGAERNRGGGPNQGVGRNQEEKSHPGPASGELSPEDAARVRGRLGRLGKGLEAFRARQRTRERNGARPASGMGYALRMSFDMVAALVVGGAMGWLLDRWLGTGPALLLVFGLFGLAAGFLNVARTYREMKAEMGANTGADLPATDDEDEDN